MSHKQNDLFNEYVRERITDVLDDVGYTLDQKLTSFSFMKVEFESLLDSVIELIDKEYSDLEKKKCEFCEGLGQYKYREYFDVCRRCGGTGYDVE